MTSRAYSRTRPPSRMALDAKSLLDRFPNIDRTEVDSLITLYPKLTIVDMAFITSDEELCNKIELLCLHRTSRAHASMIPLFIFCLILVLLITGAAIHNAGVDFWE